MVSRSQDATLAVLHQSETLELRKWPGKLA